MKRLVLVWLVFATGCASDAPRAQEGEQVVLRVGTLIDGRGGVLEDTHLVIEGDRILTVGAWSGHVTWDLSNYTVMPGGIDTHVHLASHFGPDGHIATGAVRGEREVAQATLSIMENAYLTLAAGFTTVQSLGSRQDIAVRDAIARGVLPGPRVLTSLEWVTDASQGEEGLRAAVRERVEAGADVVKIFASLSIREAGVPTLTEDELRAACDEAHRLNRRAIVHAHAAEAGLRAARAGCDQIEHGILLNREALEAMAAEGMYYGPHVNLVFENYFENRERYIGVGNYTEEGFEHMEQAKPVMEQLFREALSVPDLKIVFGTDAVAGAHGKNWEELIFRVEQGGQDPMAAIVSATSLAAQSMGLGDQIGSLVDGYQADLLVLPGNPLTDISLLREAVMVMKGGQVVKNEIPWSRSP